MVAGHPGDCGRDVVQHATRDKEVVSGHALILLQKTVERTAQGRLHRANLVKFNFVQVKCPEMNLRKPACQILIYIFH